MVADRLVVADIRLVHMVSSDLIMGLIIDSLIVGDRVIMPLPHSRQWLVMIVHLVCLLMLLVMVSLMVSDDDVFWLLLEVRAQPAEAGETVLVNLTEEAEVVSSQGNMSYRQKGDLE